MDIWLHWEKEEDKGPLCKSDGKITTWPHKVDCPRCLEYLRDDTDPAPEETFRMRFEGAL